MVSTKKQLHPEKPLRVTFASLYALVEIRYRFNGGKHILNERFLVEMPCIEFQYSHKKYGIVQNIRHIRARKTAKEWFEYDGRDIISVSIVTEQF